MTLRWRILLLHLYVKFFQPQDYRPSQAPPTTAMSQDELDLSHYYERDTVIDLSRPATFYSHVSTSPLRVCILSLGNFITLDSFICTNCTLNIIDRLNFDKQFVHRKRLDDESSEDMMS